MQPKTLGRYRIIRELGRGAMGRVFLAHDPEIDRHVAIKTLQILSAAPQDQRESARQRLKREARAAGKLLHPGIVTLFDFGEAGGEMYLAMEYVEGQTLDAFCGRETLLPAATAVELVACTAEALDYAHRAGVVHRDIKPANLMRVGDGNVKIMDFGLARAAEAQVTQDGALFGTPSYMAPEQIRGKDLDGRSDLFSLGVVLFEMLTGEKPFAGDSISSIIYRIVHEDPSDPADAPASIPEELRAFLLRALAKTPDARFADGREFAAALRGAARSIATIDEQPDSVPAETSTPDVATGKSLPAPPVSRPKRGSPMPYIVGIVLLLVAAAVAGYVYREELGLFGPSGPSEPSEAAEVWAEATVRTEPAGVPVLLDGEPLDPMLEGRARYLVREPAAVLTAEYGCRRVERPLQLADDLQEVVLVFDPTELEWTVDAGVAGARVRLNGESGGDSPAALSFDLCRDNVVELEAPGYRTASVRLPGQVSPLEARSLLTAVEMQPLPKGKLIMPARRFDVAYYVNGKKIGPKQKEIELLEGEHDVRLRNDKYWIDVRKKVRIEGGQASQLDVEPPPLTELVVQAFPANCKVHLRRPRGKWKYVDETPLRRKLAVGTYEVRVTLNPTGQSELRSIKLEPGVNPPLRVAFGKSS
ncbi:MAG: serine/threonine protein kinase [bacterium]|nr:serine/threonine protein kinase [bacterium]